VVFANLTLLRKNGIHPENMLSQLKIRQKMTGLYLGQANKLIEVNRFENGAMQKADRFRKIFIYYENYLIPVLYETVSLSKRYIDILGKTPDKSFKPVKMELKNHHKLLKQFFSRSRKIGREFEAFLEDSAPVN